ncbi:MAG: histidinol-phosphate transaminase [Myxococcales bacterium]
MMRPLVPPYVETLKPYIPGKPIEETEREYGIKGVIKLASNENPLGPSPLAVKAIERAAGSLHLYPDGAGFHLKQKLSAALGVTPEELFLGAGSNEIIELLIRTFMGPDDEALISAGSFVMYKVALHSHGRKFVEAPMRDRAYDLEAMAERITSRTRLIFLANPDNPTGTWFGRAAFEKFLSAAKAANPDALIVMDEAYVEYVTAEDYPNSFEYRVGNPNIVTLRTFSKIYGLAGLRLGYGVMHPSLVEYLNRTRMPFNVTSLALVGGLAALDDHAHVERSRALNAAGLQKVTSGLRALGVDVLPSQANFVFADPGRPSAEIFDAMLRRGVITRPIPNYGFPTALRISIGSDAENDRMLNALAEVLRSR